MLRRALLALLALLGVAACPCARAQEPTLYSLDLGATILAVRSVDLDGDARPDLVVLVQPSEGAPQLRVLIAPDVPQAGSYFRPQDVRHIALEGERSHWGALSVGRFGPKGRGCLRFFAADGVHDLDATGTEITEPAQRAPPTLMVRSPGTALVIWDGVADLDGDGRDECWFPLAEGEGPLFVLGGTAAQDRTLTLKATSVGTAVGEHLLYRYAYVPNLLPADLDGDGKQELLALKDGQLLGWSLAQDTNKVLSPTFSLELPFLTQEPTLDPEEMRTPRLQLADVDGDGRIDLLVSLLVGRRDKLGSVRTILYHFPGPFRDPATGALVKPAGRIDTESVALHPQFLDVDGDGALEYIGDSIRGTTMDLLARIAGRDSEMHLVGYRFEPKSGTFAANPLFTLKRIYASSEALSNRFGRTAYFEGDFNGDGHRDLLDLGSLDAIEVLYGVTSAGGAATEFRAAPSGPLRFKEPLAADARILDLDGDGRSDAVLWGAQTLHVLLGRRAP